MGRRRHATNYYINQRPNFFPASLVYRQYLGAVEAVETDSIPTRIAVEHRTKQLLLIGPSVQCCYGSLHGGAAVDYGGKYKFSIFHKHGV
ncbi:hypothetical protein ANCDUO_00171 [Ancylostoma duodenale]|uniref:Uncharacterized protein n=1 Tax=Ancylostoma duodenale TaxID=51022 RepID=A0A0C2HIS3_9BILA|nr:hypothetical protein ANCDUO_00171 [Ancylostoma duodenale]